MIPIRKLNMLIDRRVNQGRVLARNACYTKGLDLSLNESSNGSVLH